MKATYEMQATNIFARPSKGLVVIAADDGQDKVHMQVEQHLALSLKRGLESIFDGNIADPNEEGWSMAELMIVRKNLGNMIAGETAPTTAVLVEYRMIVEAYLRLIERTVSHD
jgi:hypothetical protein